MRILFKILLALLLEIMVSMVWWSRTLLKTFLPRGVGWLCAGAIETNRPNQEVCDGVWWAAKQPRTSTERCSRSTAQPAIARYVSDLCRPVPHIRRKKAHACPVHVKIELVLYFYTCKFLSEILWKWEKTVQRNVSRYRGLTVLDFYSAHLHFTTVLSVFEHTFTKTCSIAMIFSAYYHLSQNILHIEYYLSSVYLPVQEKAMNFVRISFNWKSQNSIYN